MTTLTIYRPPSTSIATFNIDEKTVYTKKLMGEHKITTEFISASVIALQIGDFITYNAENYYINRLPDIDKINNTTFKYKIVFESVLYNLSRKLFISSDGLADYSYNGTATDFITNIVASINEIDSGWTVGTVDTSTEQTLQFSNESCRAALTRVAEAFKMEFELSGKQISLLNSAGSTTAYSFTYGRDLGLYKLERQQVNDQNILTKVFGFGGTKNIPADYRSRAKRLVFESGGARYLTKNTALYGVIEGQFTDDNIYPNRTSSLTSANIVFDGDDLFDPKTSYVADSTIDFDLNDYLIEGQIATIVFKTGALAGVECEIWKYDNTTKRIYFNPYSDTDGYTLPFYNGGTEIQPESGDEYTLINIALPQAYIDTAETALEAATQAYIDENSVPMVVYSVEIDPKYAKDIALSLNAGDKVTVVDTDLGIDALIRVAGVEFSLVNPYKIKAVIADFVPYTLQERIVKSAISTRKETIFVDRRSAELARRNTTRQKQLQNLLFDTDGYFDATNIKPLSIETSYLAVGTKSRDFWLSNVTIRANYEGDANALYVSAGSLVHLQIEIAGLGYTWVIGTPLDQASLTPTTAYYLYARCSKAALTGNWVLSSSQITVEQEAGYYHFLVGMLFVVADGYRDFDFVYGMTYIHGNQITTGTIKSIDGLNYFNLTEGKFRIGDATSSLDFNVTAAGKLTLIGALSQSPAGTFPLVVFCGAYDAGVTYQKGDQVTYGGSSWNYINNTPGSGHTPAENTYWTQVAVKGTDGTDGTDGIDGTDGVDGTSIIFKGSYASVAALIAAQGALQNGWSYYNTADKKSYVYYTPTWYQMTIDGVDGTNGTNGISIVWHGDAASPDPSWAVLNHVYRDTDNGYVYIYNGSAWELMVLDGSDGTNGTDGVDGWHVYITYNDNAITSTPSTPTGDGTTGGWHTTPSAACNWMSQKVAADASSGSWGAPIQITGADGIDGDDGATGPGVVFRGDFSASTAYFNNALRRDIVKYSGSYYIFKGTDNTSGAWSAGNWESFGATFSSVATDILFASLAYIDNLGVKHFNGVPVPAGDLAGSVVTTQANIALSTAWSQFTNYNAGDKCSDGGVNYIANNPSTNQQPPNLSYWYADPVQPQAQIDTVTLTGTSGSANIVCNGVTAMAVFFDSLANTAYAFYYIHGNEYSGGVDVAYSGNDIIFTAQTAGVAFSGATSISNVANAFRGSVKIQGNEIWENSEDNDNYGIITINRKGYNGGATRSRALMVGDGRGTILLQVGGSSYIGLKATYVGVPNIPTSDPGGGAANYIWVDSNGFLKVGS